MQDHDIYLKSNMLIAMPGIGDPFFDQTVTLICDHSKEGSFGITINRPMSISLAEILEKLDIAGDKNTLASTMSLNGGPVMPEQGYVIHDGEQEWDKTTRINQDLSVTTSTDVLKDIAQDQGPKHFLFALGCAMWKPGQLESEIKANIWLTCPSDNSILFDTPHSQRWLNSSHLLGIDVRLMSDNVGHA